MNRPGGQSFDFLSVGDGAGWLSKFPSRQGCWGGQGPALRNPTREANVDAIATLTAATRRLARAEEEWFAAIHTASAANWKLETIAAAAGVDVAEVEKILGRASGNATDRVA